MKLYSDLTRFPGNKSLFDAVEMAIASITAGVPLHLHTQGLRGLGKTTILRTAAQVMPMITRVKGCPYNCSPSEPHCPEHRALSPERLAAIGTEEIQMPFLEISHSAKLGTVAGSIDLRKLTNAVHPEAAVLPGIIPQAHRGVIFIDEINRLADTAPEITDLLLDVMGTKPGRVQIEETGLSPVSIPVSVSVWAASNPDEDPGPLEDVRRQLSDRFDLAIQMGRPDSTETVSKILRQHRYTITEPQPARRIDDQRNRQLCQQLSGAARRVREVWVPEHVDQVLAEIYVRFGLESLRAVEALQQAAQLRAALGHRQRVEVYDLVPLLPWVLQHRVGPDVIQQILDYLQGLDRPSKSSPSGAPGRTNERPLPRKAKGIRELTSAEAMASEGDL